MNRRKRKAPPGKTSRAIYVGIAGMLTSALGSALIGVCIYGRQGAMLGASLDALTIDPSQAISDSMHGEGESKPLLNMKFRLSFAGAVVGSFLGLIFKNFN